ncbi:hypothetical protein ACKKBF_B39630 [Auxenochlorella protothecoides x Auxenochlorella symbiontica]
MKRTSGLLLLALVLGSLAIATADPGSTSTDESMESKQEYSSGYRPSNWRSYWWCQRYGRWNNYCYYWWWYNGRYFYYPCWGRCNSGQKVKPFH